MKNCKFFFDNSVFLFFCFFVFLFNYEACERHFRDFDSLSFFALYYLLLFNLIIITHENAKSVINENGMWLALWWSFVFAHKATTH